jgi:membrane protease subunit (stomatin/prohibitin family)
MGQFNINFSEEDRQRLVAANAEIAKAQRQVRVKQIGVAGAAADAQARQFELDQKFNQDSRYVQQLAGNYQNYAAGQALMGAGQGMAAHGVGDGLAGAGAQMAVGVGMGNMMASSFQNQPQFAQQQQPQFTPGGTQVTCPKCNTQQPGGKFCAECGTTLAAQKKFCTGCGSELAGGAKFCANCGTSSQAAPAT